MPENNDDLRPALPPVTQSGPEDSVLTEMLDYYRAVLARKGSGLSAEQLATPLGSIDLTIGGLIFHMAMVEDSWFYERFQGNAKPEPWASAPWDDDWDWEFHSAHELSPDELFAQYDTSIARSRAAYAWADSLEHIAAGTRGDGAEWNLRWIMVHMIEEYARHCGHGDLIRESIDGVKDD